jgi:hypothetical protein
VDTEAVEGYQFSHDQIEHSKSCPYVVQNDLQRSKVFSVRGAREAADSEAFLWHWGICLKRWPTIVATSTSGPHCLRAVLGFCPNSENILMTRQLTRAWIARSLAMGLVPVRVFAVTRTTQTHDYQVWLGSGTFSLGVKRSQIQCLR